MSFFRESQGFHVEVPVIDERQQIQETKVQKTEQEVFQEIFMQKHNFLHPDGRVHTGRLVPDGDGVAYITVSVSPEFEEFESQVEPPIYPAVKALVDKGYHTISSCAGHPIRIHLQLGFGSEAARDAFRDACIEANLPALSFEMPEHVANIENDTVYDEEYNAKQGREFKVPEDAKAYIHKVNADSFNFQFRQNYKRWYFLDVNIMAPTINPIKILWYKFFLLPKKDKILAQLIGLMESEKIRPYSEIYQPPKTSAFF